MSLRTPEKVEKLQTVLREKAKASPSYRFYSLYDKVYRADVLAHAYDRCRANGGAPGVDGQTFPDIKSYGVEQWLGELAEELRKKTYRPAAVRRVWIPKADGNQRPLGIPTIRDRVVQMAFVLVVEPIFDEDLQPEQHAYRPGHDAHGAIAAVQGWLDCGYTEVVDADLSGYFDTIPHHELMQCVARRISDLTNSRTTWRDPEQVVVDLNRALSGWGNYFRIGYTTGAWQVVQEHACRRLRRWLQRKHRQAGRYQNLPDVRLYLDYGLMKLTDRIRRKPLWAKARQV